MQTLTEKLMTFALGRSLRYQDMPMVRAIVRSAASENDTFESLVQGIVASPAFRERRVPLPAEQKTASREPPADDSRPRS